MRHLLLSLVLILPAAASAQSDRIIIDGFFEDWTEDHLIYEQAATPGPGVHIIRLWATAEDDHLFLAFDLTGEISLQNEDILTLYVDADGDPSTGLPVNGMGAELVWRFGQRSGTFYGSGSPANVGHADLGLFTGPTVTSSRFELAMHLEATVAGQPVFQGDAVNVAIADHGNGNFLPASGGVEVSLEASSPPPFSISLDRDDTDHLRLLSYNVWNDGIFDPARAPAYQRILQALQPDVVAFQEIYQSNSAAVADQMENFLPSEPGQQWFIEQADASDIYLASRYPIDYVEALCRTSNPTSCNGAFRLNLSEKYVENLYIVNAHPPCCMSNEARQLELDQMMAHLRDARTDGRLPEYTPFVVTGDLNLVGFAEQLETVLTGSIVNTHLWGPPFDPDWDGTHLEDAVPLTTGMPAAFTWFSPNSSFHPGRLDFMIYSNSVVEVGNYFALFTQALPSAILTEYGLFSDDTRIASDHLPVVADFALPLFPVTIDGRSTPSDFSVELPYPNPSAGIVNLPLTIPEQGDVILELIDVLGRTVWTQRSALSAGAHTLTLNLATTADGVYIFRVHGGGKTETRRIVLSGR